MKYTVEYSGIVEVEAECSLEAECMAATECRPDNCRVIRVISKYCPECNGACSGTCKE